MTPNDIQKEFKALREKQRRLLKEFRILENRIDELEKITQENKGEVEVSDKMLLHIHKLNLRNGKAKLLEALKSK